MKLVFVIFMLMLSSLAESASALNYSGRLVNPDGSPVSGPVSLRFELLYNSNTSNVLCTKELNSVQLSQGVFHAKLNFTNPECSGASLTQVLANVAPGDSVVVRVTDTTPAIDKVYGLQSLDAMPFAMVADQAKTIGSMGATAAGQVLRWNGSQWAADTIDEVAAGSIGTPELSDNSVTSAKIVDLTITGADIANGTINESKLNLADGSIAQSKVAGLAASFTGKENALGTATSSEYLAGDRAWRSFQNDVRATFIGMGYAPIVAGGAILTTDSLVTAIAKLDGRISNAETAQGDYVSLAGDTMTGPLVLSADPTVALGAATKQYVDAQITAVSAGSSQWSNIAGGINYAAGNVGIGTATPAAKLDVNGGIYGGSLSAVGNSPIYAPNGGVGIIGYPSTAIGVIQSFADAGGTPRALALNPNGGNLGVGTNAPTATLHVNGTVRITGGAPADGKVLTSDATGTATWENLPVAGITSLTGDVTGTGPGATAVTIAPGAVTYAKTNFANGEIPKEKINNLVTDLAGKEPVLAAGTTAQYYRGDKTWQTLNTTAVPEGTNQYFTEPRVLGTSLAGFTANTTQVDVNSADSALVAFQKLQSSINAILTGSVPFENNINLGGFRATNLAAPTAAGDATTKAYVDSAIAGVAAGASKWDNVTGGINYDTGSVGIGAVPFSYNGAAALVLKNNKGVVFESNTSVMTNFSVAGDVFSINRCSGTDCTGGSPRLNLGLAGAGYLEIPNAPHLRIGAPTSLGAAGITITSGYGDAVIGMNDNSITRNLTIKAAGISSGTDNNGGTLTLTSGASSGTGASKIDFQTATPGTTGATLNATTTKMTLAGRGFLGLNNTAPTSMLHITERDDTWDSSIRMDRSWDSTTDYVQLMYDYEGFKVRTMDNGDDKADIIFKPKNVEAVRITDTGNVGVGVVAPTTKLHVAGSLTLGNGNETCAGGNFAGAIRYFGTSVEFCNGAAWTALASAGGSTPADNTVTSTKIVDGSIVDADVAAGAAIAQSKIANLTTDLAAKQPLDADLTALAGVTTNGILVRTGGGTAVTRSLAGTANRVVVTNGDGVAGAPTINIATGLLPSPVLADASKFLKASGADSASWQALASGDITSALGFTPINKAGDTMPSGVFDFTTSSVVRVLNPVGVTDVANKQYVDSQISGAANQWTQASGNVYRATGNVGIGTTTPNAKLEVMGGTDPVAIRLTETTGAHANWELRSYNTAIGGGNNQFTIWGGLAGSTQTDRFVIDPEGRVGIGALNPNSLLSIGDNPTSAAIGRGVTLQSNTTSASLRIMTPGASPTLDPFITFTTTGQSNFVVGIDNNSSSDGVTTAAADDHLFLGYNGAGTPKGTSGIRVTTAGNVGVGTLVPQVKLDVTGAAKIGSGTSARGGDYLSLTTSSVASKRSGVQFYQNATALFEMGIDPATDNSNTFYIHDSVSNATRFAITPGGQVGVGTTAPRKRLDVDGEIVARNRITVINDMTLTSPSWSIDQGGTDDRFRIFRQPNISTGGSEFLTILNTGNVGIGTQAPGGRLDVRNTGALLPTGSGATTYLRNTSSADNDYLATGWTGENNWAIISADSSTYRSLSLQPFGGAVGIGTTAPGYTLHVNGSVAGTSAYVNLSDATLKRNVDPVRDSLSNLLKLRGVSYEWRREDYPDLKLSKRRELGVIAQEVEKVYPEAVTVDDKGTRSVAYSMLIAPIIESIRELWKRIQANDQKASREIASINQQQEQLEDRVQRLERENAQLKAYLCQKDPKAPVCNE